MTAIPNWEIGEIITLGHGEALRVLAINDDPHERVAQELLSRLATAIRAR